MLLPLRFELRRTLFTHTGADNCSRDTQPPLYITSDIIRNGSGDGRRAFACGGLVLGDAGVHAMVDSCNAARQRSGSVPHRLALPALLQLQGCFSQITGSQALPAVADRFANPGTAQYWRLVTSFLYFGPFSINLLFHIYFLQRYSRLLEESSGRSPAHFSWLLLYAMVSLIALSPLVSLPFLGHPLSSTLVYIWSRRNPDTQLSFLGVLVFTAPYLPWVLMGFSLIMHGTIPKDEIMGVVIGHVWYFFTDVYPPLHNGSRPLDPPAWWRRIFEGTPAQPAADDAHGIDGPADAVVREAAVAEAH